MKQITLPILFLMLACATQGCSYLNANFHAVDDGRLYGSGQMHADALERGLQEHDVQSVISLRSARPEETWYHDELAVCDALGVAYYSLGWSKNRLPTPESLKEFIHLLEESDGPLLATLPGRRASDQRRSSRICSSARRRKRGRNWRGALTCTHWPAPRTVRGVRRALCCLGGRHLSRALSRSTGGRQIG